MSDYNLGVPGGISTAIQTGLDSKANKTQGAWIAPTLLNGWINTGLGMQLCGYLKDELGFIHFKGAIKSGSSTIFILPIGYRPLLVTDLNINSNDAIGRLRVNTDGSLVLQVGSALSVILDGLTFRAEQ